MCLFLPFVFLFLVVGFIVYLTIKPKNHNRKPTTKEKKRRAETDTFRPSLFILFRIA